MGTLLSGQQWVRGLSGGNALRSCAYDAALDLWAFVGPGSGGGQIVTAAGGGMRDPTIPILVIILTGTEPIFDVAATGDSEIMTVGDNGETYQSTNGTLWTPTGAGALLDFRGVDIGPAGAVGVIFVAAATNGIARQTSPGSAGWTVLRGPAIGDDHNDIATNHAKAWVAAGLRAGVGSAHQSTDGITWGPPVVEFGDEVKDIDYGAALFMAVGVDGLAATSPTGNPGSWTPQFTGVTTDLYGVAHIVDERWVAVGDAGTILLTTNNGVTWARVGEGVTIERLEGVGYDAGRDIIAAVGGDANVLTSQGLVTVDAPAATEPVVENTRVAQEAIGNLLTQFRSGTGEPE